MPTVVVLLLLGLVVEVTGVARPGAGGDAGESVPGAGGAGDGSAGDAGGAAGGAVVAGGGAPDDGASATVAFADEISAELPDGGRYTTTSSGHFTYLNSATRQAWEYFAEPAVPSESREESQGETTYRFAVAIEDSIDAAAFGGAESFASSVAATLADPRSWMSNPQWSFEPVASGQDPEVVIQLASTSLAEQLCGARNNIKTSCHLGGANGQPNRVIINEARWIRGSYAFEGDIGSYRQYVINHEMGHFVGFADHVPCPSEGALAPIMMQQTIGVKNSVLHDFDPESVYPDNSITCLPNPWPYPQANR